ncbi:hypothetical protein DV736_g1680, partial [Chaetothyriales sp. CBS 134916]
MGRYIKLDEGSVTFSEIFDDAKFTEQYKKAERITGQHAKQVIEQAGVMEYAEQHDRLTILDTACGTGVVSSLIVSALAFSSSSQAKLQLTCADLSESMIASVQKRIELKKWPATAVKAGGMDTGLPSDHFNFVFCNFGPSILPSPQKGVAESFRMLLPGGVVRVHELGICAGQELPRLPEDDEFLDTFAPDGHRWGDAEEVKRNLEGRGFVDVKTTYTTRHTVLESYREWVDMLPGSVDMVANQCWRAAEKEAWKGEVER